MRWLWWGNVHIGAEDRTGLDVVDKAGRSPEMKGKQD